MKITPIAIIAVACVWSSVQAATLLVGYDDFKSLSNGAYSIAGTPTIEDGIMKVNPTAAQKTDIILSGGNLTGNGNKVESVVTMTINNLVLPTTGTGILFELGQTGGLMGKWGLGVNSSGQLVGVWAAELASGGALTTTPTIDWKQPVTLTASTSAEGMKFYINGEYVGLKTGARGDYSPNNDMLYLGGRGAAGGSLKGCSYDLASLYVHGGTMTDAEVKTFVDSLPVSAPVPEPTTAAMGLLGLAALLIRRRRL